MGALGTSSDHRRLEISEFAQESAEASPGFEPGVEVLQFFQDSA
jgi:hypothetical protein